jgi:hypothetical protein
MWLSLSSTPGTTRTASESLRADSNAWVEPDGDRQTHDRWPDETAYHRAVRAELVACIELGGRLLVVTDDAIHEVVHDTLVPMIASIDVIDLSRHLVLTLRHLVEIGGARHALPPLDGAVPKALVALPDGAIVAVCEPRDPAAAAVLRLGRDGRLIWRTATPPPATLLETRSLRLADGVETAGPPLEATQWTISRGNLCVSGDRVFAVFADAQRTGIGIGHGLDLATGALVYTTSAAPYDQLTPGPLDGQFVLGVQGYGAFRSVLVDRDGRALVHWDSQGISISRDPLRVLEMENISPSRCRIATLGHDGSVRHGAHLPGYHTSPVVVAPDGAAVFWRNNAVMRASPDGDRIERLIETPMRARAWSDGFAGRAPGRVALALSARGVLDGALSERYRLFVIDLVA